MEISSLFICNKLTQFFICFIYVFIIIILQFIEFRTLNTESEERQYPVCFVFNFFFIFLIIEYRLGCEYLYFAYSVQMRAYTVIKRREKHICRQETVQTYSFP